MNKQGKSPKQVRDSENFISLSMMGIIILLLIILLSGCTTTKKCCDKEHVITEWDGDREIRWYSSSEEK